MLQKWSGGGLAEITNVVMKQNNNSTKLNFNKLIRDMGRLNPKIKLIIELQNAFCEVHDKYGMYVDTEANVHLSDDERRKMSSFELKTLN